MPHPRTAASHLPGLALAFSVLSGCAQVPIDAMSMPWPAPDGSTTIVATAARAEGQINGDEVLRVVEPSSSIDNLARMVVGATEGISIGRKDFKGTAINTIRHPAMPDLATRIMASVRAWRKGSGMGGVVRQHPIVIRMGRFALVYRDMPNEQPAYDLYIQTMVSHKANGGAASTAPASIMCSTEITEGNLKLAQWQANDYALVKARGQEHVAACAAQVSASLDKLLSERP